MRALSARYYLKYLSTNWPLICSDRAAGHVLNFSKSASKSDFLKWKLHGFRAN